MPFSQFASLTFDKIKAGIGMFPGSLASLNGGGKALIS